MVAELMHRCDHRNHVLDGSLRKDSVAQIENMTGPAAGAPENLGDSTTDFSG
jgi:hypothetical protein